jgi:hypothetical protein
MTSIKPVIEMLNFAARFGRIWRHGPRVIRRDTPITDKTDRYLLKRLQTIVRRTHRKDPRAFIQYLRDAGVAATVLIPSDAATPF